jgi:hypothetical protein
MNAGTLIGSVFLLGILLLIAREVVAVVRGFRERSER